MCACHFLVGLIMATKSSRHRSCLLFLFSKTHATLSSWQHVDRTGSLRGIRTRVRVPGTYGAVYLPVASLVEAHPKTPAMIDSFDSVRI
jgi:hypothetical protein